MALIVKRASASCNLPFYARQAQEIFGLDPSHRLLARAQNRAQRLQIPVHRTCSAGGSQHGYDRNDVDRM
jgi:hypothetical protein